VVGQQDSKDWSHPPDSNRRPTDYECLSGVSANQSLQNLAEISEKEASLVASLCECLSASRGRFTVARPGFRVIDNQTFHYIPLLNKELLQCNRHATVSFEQRRRQMHQPSKCPWCGHEKCAECEETPFPELWLGCCQCKARLTTLRPNAGR
jgi:hypothetical protein